jgi:hypothetical protein
MLGATQKQLFNTTPTLDESGNPTGGTDITGFKPYQAYGGTYDEKGNQTAYDPGKAIAGFQPMQTEAQKGIAGLQMPGEFGQASGITQAAAQNAMNMGYQGDYARNQFRGPAQYQNGQFSMQQAQAPDLQNYQMQGPADVQSQGYDAATMQGAQTGYNPNLQNYQMGPAERVSTQNFGGQSAQDYMSPYMQNVVDIQQREAQRSADIAGTQRNAQAVGAGAFGGSRQAVMEAEAARNLATQKGDIQAQGLQAAYGQAQQQFNTDQARQQAAQQANQQAGLTVGQQNLGANLGIQQLGAQTGLQSALANLSNEQQAAVQNQAAQNQARGMNSQQAMQAALANQQSGLATGQQNLAANLGVQQLGSGQNMQAQLANQQAYQTAQQAAEQSRQYGYGQNMTAAQQRAQYGLAANQLNAQQQQFGATYGQNANAQALAAANQLAGIGQQGLTAQQGIYGLQNQVGAQQQALEQQKINQAMTDYANAQQYPLMQLGTMSNMLRGLPMQAQTTSQYQAAPNAITQGIGAVGAYGALNNAGMFGAPGKAEGGVIKGYAAGGITSYDVGGAVEADLEDMDIDGLKRQVKESSSQRVKQMAQRILAEKQMPAPRMAGGGIIAFAKPTDENNYSLVSDPMGTGAFEIMDTPRSANAPSFLEKLTNEPQWKIDARREQAAKAEQAAAKAAADVPKDKGITEVPAVAKERVTPAPTPAPAAGPRQPGILSASKPDEFMSPMIKERDRYSKLAAEDEGVAAKRLEDAAGPNVGRENYRAEEMARRANLKDEAERQKQMRLAEFFASWGSTPGPVLVAGMNALKKSIPGMVEDSKEAKKLQRESDKIIYDIDEATRLEKAGHRKEARALIQQAATNAAHLNSNITSYAGHKLTADASMANAAAQRESTAANKTMAAEENKIKTLLQAQNNTTNLLKAHEGERKDPEYTNAASMAKIGKDENGLDKPLDKLPKELRGQISEARKIVNQYSTRHREELRAAREQEAALTERTSLGTGKNKAVDKNDILGIR